MASLSVFRKKLDSFVVRGLSKRAKKKLISWNSLAYDLNFECLHKRWCELARYYRVDNRHRLPSGNGLVRKLIDNDEELKRLQAIERTIEKEQQLLKYIGNTWQKSKECRGCHLINKQKECNEQYYEGNCKLFSKDKARAEDISMLVSKYLAVCS